MDISQFAPIILATLAAGGVAYALIYPLLSGDLRAEKRRDQLSTGGRGAVQAGPLRNKRDQVAQSLKEVEAKQKARDSLTLEVRILQGGLDWDRKKYYIISAVTGLVCGGVLFATTGNPLMAPVGLFVGGLGLPYWYLGFRKKRRIAAFVKEFPNALDVIVRGLRSGLPLGDCVRIISTEAAAPVNEEFKVIVEAQTLGLALPDAVERLYQRVPISDANFFGIVLAIQAKTGGNLAETLGNLAKVLRDRKKMKDKIRAVSMEAKASAGIIASLPFIVAILVWLTSPRYIELLWLTQAGKLTMVASAIWMTMGVMIMRKMINFDI
jgi:tight adherence protein B